MPEIKEQRFCIPLQEPQFIDGQLKHYFPMITNVRCFLSQHGEDLEVYMDYFKDREVQNGTYIEAGAVEGWQASNTWYFEHNEGFTGMLIEANPRCLEGLKIIRPNNTIVLGALHNEDNLRVSFTVPDNNGQDFMLGYVEEATTSRQKETVQNASGGKVTTVTVPTATLKSLVERAGLEHVDILFLDVEGSELQALQGYDWKVPVYVVVIELPEGDATGHDEREKNEACRQILRDQGYIFNKYCGCNEIWHLPTYRDGKPTLIADWDKLESDNGETK